MFRLFLGKVNQYDTISWIEIVNYSDGRLNIRDTEFCECRLVPSGGGPCNSDMEVWKD
jgi:hypothetical protein